MEIINCPFCRSYGRESYNKKEIYINFTWYIQSIWDERFVKLKGLNIAR